MSKPNSSVVLGFDFGLKYIGIAAGQKISNTATSITAVPAKNGVPAWEAIAALIEAWRPAALVVGLPLNMDGTTQPIAHRAQEFANILAIKYALPVHMVDERLSTWAAKTQLNLNKARLTKQELVKINALAAVILTEQWLQQ